jgi:8-oxo-dGTP pyrophosphatase MutT (NUDIX family)
MWALPGGALEKENPLEGMKREIQEETGLMNLALRPFSTTSHILDEDFVVMIGYSGKTNGKEIQLNWEHDAFIWLTVEEALKMQLTQDALFFIEEFNTITAL